MTEILNDDRVDNAAADLLEVTERLHSTLVEDGDLEALESVYDERELAFLRFRDAAEAGNAPSAVVRAIIRRIQSLDTEIMRLGNAHLLAARDERIALSRRRSVIQAHGMRERREPRIVAVKA